MAVKNSINNKTDSLTITTSTNNSLLVGGATAAVSSLGAATNGQIPIGNTGNAPTLATITQGAGITVTNAAGSITVAASGSGGAVYTALTTAGTSTHTFNASTKSIELWMYSGGGGGGSGRRGLTTAAAGGGGGSGGSCAFYAGPAIAFNSPVSYTVGAGGAGGAAQTVNSTDGNVGTAGAGTNFGNVYCPDNTYSMGTGGDEWGGSGGQSRCVFYLTGPIGASDDNSNGANGGAANGGVPNSANQRPYMTAVGGGGGAGADSATERTGGTGGIKYNLISGVVIAGSAGGVESGTINGTAGTARSAANNMMCGGTGGGGGGGQNGGAAAGIGGAGGAPAGGGAGGGGSLNGTNSGAGGDGGDGAIYIVEYT